MQEIKIKLHDKTYERLTNIVREAKSVSIKPLDKPIIVKPSDVGKILSYIINDKQFNATLKQLEELTHNERFRQ